MSREILIEVLKMLNKKLIQHQDEVCRLEYIIRQTKQELEQI